MLKNLSEQQCNCHINSITAEKHSFGYWFTKISPKLISRTYLAEKYFFGKAEAKV